ncbi:uncharacterized protein LOC106670792 [Cimex lectularius]|uniref:Osiris 20 n=1 Tax=Cimex lectularius TaxID=79782 RepID=A0A8I6S2M2_CIMLE|nr:uncharacterized protein LOC106670792 [Cimex lectularius]
MRHVLVLIGCWAIAQGSMDAMLSSAIDKCLGSSSTEDCLRTKVLDYIGTPRAAIEGEDQGALIMRRLKEIAKSNVFRLELSEVFQGATLLFRPNRGLDFSVEFPDGENEVVPRQARDMMKQKMLFPLLMLVKLKLKALTPILLAIVGLKATKALVLSKLAILLVVGFLVVQLCQKLGMAKMSMQPAAMPPPMDPPATPPVPMYGPPTTSSYDPGWEPAPGPYARLYDTKQQSTTAHQLAYSSYTAQPVPYKA